MKLTAIFESWHIGDGNYSPLHKEQLVNLSFEIETQNIEFVSTDVPDSFQHLGNGEYHFCGEVIKVYDEDNSEIIIVVQSDEFRFYIMCYEINRHFNGKRICGEGTLLFDHYSWVEFLSSEKDAPNLFYNLQVKRIRKVDMPEKFVNRHNLGKSFPTRLLPKDYSNIEEIETMEGQAFDEEFYIIDFDSDGFEEQNIQRLFRF